MDNKLSKPVAYDYQIASACIADGHNENGKWVDWNNKLTRHCPPDWMMEEGKVTGLKLLYSQEYVSALRADAAKWFDAFEKTMSVCARNAERIAELEEEFAFIMGQNDGIEKELRDKDARIEHLEAKLATPVQSPDDGLDDCRDMWPRDCSDDFDTGYKFGLWRYEQNIRAVGFKVEGDE
ncbi:MULTISPECIES: hypothetical protein [Serratia]|uniref:hypothetical protein n=1 Tax=Serratia TaxID=613 RepID=UPI00313F2C0F